MLERIEHVNGVVTYRSPRLREAGVVHGFSTRLGGISRPPYDSLNLDTLTKGPDSDANTSVAENFRRLRTALGCHRIMRFAPQQVHGSAVWVPPERPLRPHEAARADALASDRPTQLLVIRTADCVPVLLATSDGRVVAAAHAGWRGVVAGVVPATIDTMRRQYGVEPADLRAAIGPHISAEHFEVGPEVVEAFEGVELGEAVVPVPGARPHIDLQRAVRRQLERAGVGEDHIDGTDRCTYRDAAEFYSYRRDGAPTGRMAAVIVARAG